MNASTVPIDASTELYSIIGSPVRHSLSPLMHNAAFSHLGLNAVYLAFETKDAGGACLAMRSLGIRGYSVTIPHKEEVIAFLDEPDETVAKIGACNTIKNINGRLLGTNTDWLGAVKAIEKRIGLQGKRAVILGAGGSARAIVYGLCKKGAEVTVCNRTLSKAERLAKEFGCKALGLEKAEEIQADILINTTSVGMGKMAEMSPISEKAAVNYGVIMDIVYSPLETVLLRQAKKAGKTIINGLEMLLFQAAAQFEYWTGRPAPEEIMIKALEDAVGS